MWSFDHAGFLNLSCSNTLMLEHFYWETRTWNSLPSTCYVWLQKPSLEEKEDYRQSPMLDLFLLFQANRSKSEWKSWSKPNSLICSYINITPCNEDLKLLKTLPCHCNWILILIWWWWQWWWGRWAHRTQCRKLEIFSSASFLNWIHWILALSNNFCRRGIFVFWGLQK